MQTKNSKKQKAIGSEKRIRINYFIANKYYESDYYKEHQLPLTQICNLLLENFCSQKMVELSNENYETIKKLSDEKKKNIAWIINTVIASLDILLINNQKQKIEIPTTPGIGTLKIKTKTNPVSNW